MNDDQIVHSIAKEQNIQIDNTIMNDYLILLTFIDITTPMWKIV